MTKYRTNGKLNVEYLTKVWKEDFAAHYSDKPKLNSVLTSVSLTFEVEGERVKIIFPVANEAQKMWLELKMIPEMTEYFKSITGIQELSILPFISEIEEKDSRIYYPSPTPPSLPEEIVCLKSLIKDLELDIK